MDYLGHGQIEHPLHYFTLQGFFARGGAKDFRQTGYSLHPKHGSWLNSVEIELSILSRQCLDRHMPDQNTLKKKVAVWQEQRNASACPMTWHFTNDEAGVKLKKLYQTL
jgi:hypothetical protein